MSRRIATIARRAHEVATDPFLTREPPMHATIWADLRAEILRLVRDDLPWLVRLTKRAQQEPRLLQDAIALVRELEHAGRDNRDIDICAVCGKPRRRHTEGCRIAAFLRRAEHWERATGMPGGPEWVTPADVASFEHNGRRA